MEKERTMKRDWNGLDSEIMDYNWPSGTILPTAI